MWFLLQVNLTDMMGSNAVHQTTTEVEQGLQVACITAYTQAALHVAEAAVKGLEISPQMMTTAGDLASRVAEQGGAALIVDYGRNRPYPASLQAIRQHKFCGLLEQAGLADLSAHVDFTAIRSTTNSSPSCHIGLDRVRVFPSEKHIDTLC